MMKRSQLRRLSALLFAGFLSAAGGSALAAEPDDSSAESSSQKRVAVGAFSGPKAKQARGWVLKVLKGAGQYEVTDAADVEGGEDDKTYAETARALGVDAIIVGKVSKGSDLVLTVHNAADGASVGDVEIKGGNAKKLQKAVENELAIAIADPLAQAKAAGAASEEESAEEEAPEEAPAEEEGEPEEATDSGGSGPSPLELMAGFRAYNRTFSYKDSLAELYPDLQIKPLYTYELPLGPALIVDIRFYPGAFFTSGAGANIGLSARFEQGFATRSVYAENTDGEVELETAMQEIRAGLRYRIPLDKHEVGISAEYGIHKFRLAGDEDGTVNPDFPLIPDTDYRLIRPGLDARFRFSEFLLGVHAAPRILLSMGELESEVWFPGATGMGFDAGVMIGYAIIPSLDVVAGFDYMRYGFDFNAIPDENVVVAGGATDQYLSGYVGLLFRLPGGN